MKIYGTPASVSLVPKHLIQCRDIQDGIVTFQTSCHQASILGHNSRIPWYRGNDIASRSLTHVVFVFPLWPLGVDDPVQRRKQRISIDIEHNTTHQDPQAGSPLLPSSNFRQTVETTLFLSVVGFAVR